MQTPLGKFANSGTRHAALVLAVLTVALDLWLAQQSYSLDAHEGRWALALFSFALLVQLTQGNHPSYGLISPEGGWIRWLRITFFLSLIAGICVAAGLLGMWLSGIQPTVYKVAPDQRFTSFLRMCLFAPLLEETIYRVVLCIGLAATFGPTSAILASGTLFGLLHVVYGNPSPENLLGGLFLAWAYLRSGSLYLPLLIHSGGNFLVLVSQIAAWHLNL